MEVETNSVSDQIVSCLLPHTDCVFGVGGANIEDLYDAMHRLGRITGVVAAHEFGAATMADGYARTTGRLGVVAATSGGGALNLVAALGESFDARIPVLALVGQPPQELEGRGAFQDTAGGPDRIDAERLFAAVSRFCSKLDDPADLPQVLPAAIAAAYSGGPAVLLLPKNIQRIQVPWPTPVAPVGTWSAGVATHPVCSQGQLASAARTIRSAIESGPIVVVAGPEVARTDGRGELAEFAAALSAHVAVTPDAKDVFDNRDPMFGGVTGIMGHPHVADLIAESALTVLVGTQLPLTARGGLDRALAAAALLHIGVEAPFLEVDTRVPGCPGPILRTLAALAPGSVPARPARSWTELRPPQSTGPGVRYRAAISAIADRLAPGTDVFVDAGNTGAAVLHHLAVPRYGRFVVALGMGGMGYAFGGAVGSAFGRRRRTVVIAGDGAYFMHGTEVRTAVQHSLPITFVVFNNNAHAMCITREHLYYGGDYSYNRFVPAMIGESVAALYPNVPAYACHTLTEFTTALDATCRAAGPILLAVDCDPDEIPPFAPFLEELTA